MISDSHRCIFVHIPRCGGTSVEAVIWPGERTAQDLWMGFVEPHANKYQTGGLQHLLASQIRREVGDERFLTYFKFAIVRNPFDRLVSQFEHMSHRPDLREFLGMASHASFGEYIELIGRRTHVQWMAQAPFLLDDGGKMVVDFVGRFESLAEDMAEVFGRIGMGGAELPHLNRTERSGYRPYYSETLRRRVEDMYSDDLTRFEYAF